MNIFMKLWLKYTVWMMRHHQFNKWTAEMPWDEYRRKAKMYGEPWAWTESQMIYILEELKKA